VLIVVFAAIRMGNAPAMKVFSWFNLILGGWVFASPWIYGYTMNTARFVDSLCVGVVVFLVSLSSLSMHTTHNRPAVQH